MTPLVVSARAATLADLDRIHDLVEQARQSVRPVRGGASHLDVDGVDWHLDTRLESPHAAVLCGLIDDAVVGYAVVGEDRGAARIEAIFVEPEAREVGLGEELLDAVIAWSRARGCSTLDAVALPGDRHTKNFFETFGMVARAITVSRLL